MNTMLFSRKTFAMPFLSTHLTFCIRIIRLLLFFALFPAYSKFQHSSRCSGVLPLQLKLRNIKLPGRSSFATSKLCYCLMKTFDLVLKSFDFVHCVVWNIFNAELFHSCRNFNGKLRH